MLTSLLHLNPTASLKGEGWMKPEVSGTSSETRLTTVSFWVWWLLQLRSSHCTRPDPAALWHTSGPGRTSLGSAASAEPWWSQMDPPGGENLEYICQNPALTSRFVADNKKCMGQNPSSVYYCSFKRYSVVLFNKTLMGKFFVAAWKILKSSAKACNCFLTLTDFGVPLMSHRYIMWYCRGTMSKLDQVGGGDHSTSKFLTWGETRTSLGGSGFTIERKRKRKRKRK